MVKQSYSIEVDGTTIEIVRKDIKHIRLSVYPPDGRVRLAVPLCASADAVRAEVVDKLGWIKHQQAKIMSHPHLASPEMVDGEPHYFLGQSYQLRVIVQDRPRKVMIREDTYLELYVRPGDTQERRKELLLNWYREQLRGMIPGLVEKWQPIIGVQIAEWHIKRMKTRWGSCNIKAHRIWLNLELAKKPVQCLEYVVVHEMLHLIERYHNAKFTALLDEYLPDWQQCRRELNSAG